MCVKVLYSVSYTLQSFHCDLIVSLPFFEIIIVTGLPYFFFLLLPHASKMQQPCRIGMLPGTSCWWPRSARIRGRRCRRCTRWPSTGGRWQVSRWDFQTGMRVSVPLVSLVYWVLWHLNTVFKIVRSQTFKVIRNYHCVIFLIIHGTLAL